MADIVNLNRFRKERARSEKRAEADANAARFGQTKAARELSKAQAEKSARALDAHRRDLPPDAAASKDPSSDQQG